MFVQRRNRNMAEAAFTTLSLIYHQTVYNLRRTHSNAVIGLVMQVVQSLIMVAGFLVMFVVLGIRSAPLRGDFMIFIMTGIFLFMTHTKAIGSVSGAGSSVSQMMKHEPLSTAVMITAAGLAVLYQQILACLVILFFYHVLFTPVELENWVGVAAMFLLAWGSGCAIGLIFLAAKPWWPSGIGIISSFYQRINMIASGKMFVANVLPPMMLNLFDWNPLFHVIDQARGFAFINYTPHNSSITYPIYVTLGCLMVGLMIEFVTRNSESLSWSARS
ncbi:ABC transporter [Paracoccus sp. Z118]|uniref:ABC transporter permease n=1 Tax=Paracoccus sp. Z118 TaxID=2851017 RepID=UPI001C2C226E|nr:ABC transporter [Paracoccus sp. Z118]MBV0892128.1 ABC transporter [Paracoccus sp. Z118]